MNTVDTLLAGQVDLPSPPAIINTIQTFLTNEDVDYRELARVVEADQAFTARILKLINSSFYGFSGEILSVEEAIALLGINSVYQLLLATSLLSTIKINDKNVDLKDFWLHSFGVGVIAKHLSKNRGEEIKNECFMCGILHDLGRLIYMKMDIEKFMSFYTNEKLATNLQEEKRVFGIDHQELGKLLAKKWNFPPKIIDAIGNHHLPESESDEKVELLLAAVNIADLLCHAMAIGDSYSYYVTEFSKAAWEALQIQNDDLESALRKSLKEIKELQDLLSNIE